jgi:hypothetical protein
MISFILLPDDDDDVLFLFLRKEKYIYFLRKGEKKNSKNERFPIEFEFLVNFFISVFHYLVIVLTISV